MKVEISKPQLVEVTHVRIFLPVKYDEDDMPNDFPFRKGESWAITVEADTGKIVGWPQGKTADLYMKVTDGGSYFLLGEDGKVIAALEQDYVPDCIPGEYGDYIIFVIDADGVIADWVQVFEREQVEDDFNLLNRK